MRSERHEGFTLAELLIVVAIIGIVGAVAIPLLSFQNSKNLDVAAEEVGNALRFAVNEARHTGKCILVDAKTTAGHLNVFSYDFDGATCANANPVAVNDPLTKRPLDIDITGSAFSGPFSMAVKFMQGGTPYAQLLIIPALIIPATPQQAFVQLRAFDGPSANMMGVGALQSGSGIVLSLGSSSVTVTIDETTGFVAIP